MCKIFSVYDDTTIDATSIYEYCHVPWQSRLQQSAKHATPSCPPWGGQSTQRFLDQRRNIMQAARLSIRGPGLRPCATALRLQDVECSQDGRFAPFVVFPLYQAFSIQCYSMPDSPKNNF